MSRSRILVAVCAAAALALSASAGAQTLTKISFATNWFAQAEHGGFYQALATGRYKSAGLDVTIRMGGPQVNVLQLLAAGQADCIMGYDTQTMKAREQGINAVTVAAAFQKDPQVLIGHPGTGFATFEDLKGRTLLIGSGGRVTYWPYLRRKYGLSDSQVRPYTFNLAPWLADRNAVQQGFLSSEPYSIERETGRIGADALPRLHLPLVATLGDLRIQRQRRQRMHRKAREAGRVDHRGECVERRPVGVHPLTQAGYQAYSGDDGIAVRWTGAP